MMLGTQHIWRWATKFALYKYWRASDGDRIGLTYRPSGQVALEPVEWDPAESDDEIRDEPGYASCRREKTFRASGDGRADERLGKAPVVLLDEEYATQGSMIESRVMEAVELDEDRPLYSDVTLEHVEISEDAAEALSGGSQAIADGGHVDGITRWEVYDRDQWPDDVLIDIGAGEGFDGQAVSWNRFTDKFNEEAPSERLKMHETRGLLAGMDPTADKAWAMKVLLIALAMVAIFVLGPPLISALFGGGGGGGMLGGLSLVTGVV